MYKKKGSTIVNSKQKTTNQKNSASTRSTHPCVRCGACCAFFRVAFYWRETEGVTHKIKDPTTSGEYEILLWKVPKEKAVDLDDFYMAMKGTEKKHNPKCINLKGTIGTYAICKMYENRPTPCRAFEASYENGKHNPRCDQARLKHGLKPLTREDWVTPIDHEL